MLIKIKNGVIYRIEHGTEIPIGSIFDGVSDETEKIIECGAEILPEVERFISEVNSGGYRPRKAVKRLEQILDKHAIK